MRNTLWSIVVLIGWVIVPPQAQADEGGWAFGAKLAYFETDEDGVDDPDNAGLLIGYDWPVKYGLLGVEAEFTSTFEDGRFAGQDVDVDTAGIYAAFRTRGRLAQGVGLYLKGKAGAAYTDVGLGSESDDSTDASVGVGIGVNMLLVSFEMEYTILESDIDMVSLLVRF